MSKQPHKRAINLSTERMPTATSTAATTSTWSAHGGAVRGDFVAHLPSCALSFWRFLRVLAVVGLVYLLLKA